MAASKKRDIDIHHIAIIVLGILLFYPPFFKGLFFNQQWLPYQIIVGIFALVAFSAVRSSKREIALQSLDISTALLVLCYIISVFAAVDVQGAIGEVFKVSTYFLLFMIISRLASLKKDVITLLQALYLSGIGVTLITLGTAFGTFNYPGAFVDNRLYSTMQYPNTFAAFTTGLLIIGFYLAVHQKQCLWRIGYNLANFLLFVGFFGAKSRGGLLAFFAAMLIFIVLVNREYKGYIISRIVVSSLLAYLFATNAISSVKGHGSYYYWCLLVVSCVVSLIPDLVDRLMERFGPGVKKKALGLGAALCVAVIAVAVVVTLPNVVKTSSQADIGKAANRFTQISLSSREAAERLVFYQDALKVIKDYPVIGTGGRGWKSLFHVYQGYNYKTSEVHNHFLQVWVETGTLGLIVFLSIWVFLILTAIKLLRRSADAEDRLLIGSIVCAALALGIHSMVDFNLSIPAVSVMLWALFGSLQALYRLSGESGLKCQLKLPSATRMAGLALSVIFLAGSVMLYASLSYGNAGIEELFAKKRTLAKEDLTTATMFNPFASAYLAPLGETSMFIGDKNNDPKELELALANINKAIKLEPYNPDYRTVKGKILLLLDRIEPAVSEYEQASKLSPYEQKYADHLAQTYFLVGQYYMAKDDKARARTYLAKAVAYPDLIAERLNKMEPRYKALQLPGLKLNISQDMNQVKDMASELLKNM